MNLLTTLLAFLVALGLLIIVHEYGHYWVARRCGVKVLRFSIGFGRPLLRKTRGPDRTEWVVAALPLGGYVRMLDERDPDCGPIAPEELPRAFNRQSLLKRTAIVLAGPIANLLLAVLLYWVLSVVGVMEPKALVAAPLADSPAARAGFEQGDLVLAVDGDLVRSWNELNWRLLQRAVEREVFDVDVLRRGAEHTLSLDLTRFGTAELEGNPLVRIGLSPFGGPPHIGRVLDGSAAERAGLRAGDRVLEIEGKPVYSGRELTEVVRRKAEEPLQFRIEREGQILNIAVTPAREIDAGQEIGRIGAQIEDRPEQVKVRYGPVESIGIAFGRTWETSVFSLRMLGKMITGQASLKNLSGPVTIADYAGKTARMGLAEYLSFLALVSISLGVLNLLPIPLLDGGHLLYYAIEFFKGSPPSEWVIQWSQRAGIGVLILLTALALYNDLTRLLL